MRWITANGFPVSLVLFVAVVQRGLVERDVLRFECAFDRGFPCILVSGDVDLYHAGDTPRSKDNILRLVLGVSDSARIGMNLPSTTTEAAL